MAYLFNQDKKSYMSKLKQKIANALPDAMFDDDGILLGADMVHMFNGFKDFADASLQLARSNENRTLQHNAVIEFIFQTKKIVQELAGENITAFEKKACAELINFYMNQNKINSSLVHSLEDKEALEKIRIEINDLSEIMINENENEKKDYEEFRKVHCLNNVSIYARQNLGYIPLKSQTERYENNFIIYNDITNGKKNAIAKFEKKLKINLDYDAKFKTFVEKKISTYPNGKFSFVKFFFKAYLCSFMLLIPIGMFFTIYDEVNREMYVFNNITLVICIIFGLFFGFKWERGSQKKCKEDPHNYYKDNWDLEEIKKEKLRLKDAMNSTGVYDDNYIKTINVLCSKASEVQVNIKQDLSEIMPTLYSDNNSIFLKEDLNKLEEIAKVKSESLNRDYSILGKILSA
jgi:hypothetical protein